MSYWKNNKTYFCLHFNNFYYRAKVCSFPLHTRGYQLHVSNPNSEFESIICWTKAKKYGWKIKCPLKNIFFVVVNLLVFFFIFFFIHTYKNKFVHMGGSIVESRLPQTQKCMEHRTLICSIRKNKGANTYDQEKLYKK